MRIQVQQELARCLRRALALRGLMIATCCSGPAAAAGQGALDIETTRTALEKYVETERLISREKRDLELSREMLEERIELVRREIESLKGKISDAESNIAEADKKREELVQENEKLKESSAALGGVLESLERGILGVLPRLPEPARERVKPLTQRLPKADDQESALSLSERFQNVVGIMNELDRFAGEITVASEVRELEGGASAEVTALYLGTGQAFYVGSGESVAGIGTSSEDGWAWSPRNEAAGEISRAIGILNNEEVASFVRLPVSLD